MSTGEVARRFGVSLPTVKKWIREGRLRAFRTPGGHHRVHEAAFRALAGELGLEPAPGPPRPPDDGAQVLVVDDDPHFLEVVSAALRESLGGYKVDTVADGYEALLRLGLARPDVLILDLRMPGLDGLEVCRRIRIDPQLGEIRILAVTGYGDEQTEAAMRAAGADDFVEKPVGLADLCARVARLLARRAPGARRG
jgi:excisionase family DNA binding protein